MNFLCHRFHSLSPNLSHVYFQELYLCLDFNTNIKLDDKPLKNNNPQKCLKLSEHVVGERAPAFRAIFFDIKCNQHFLYGNSFYMRFTYYMFINIYMVISIFNAKNYVTFLTSANIFCKFFIII